MNNYQVPTVKDLLKATDNGGHKFSFVSLFAGGGGSSTGYRMAGGKALAVNEFIPEAIKTYKANWPDTNVLGEDIRKLEPKDILCAAGVGVGELELLDGSPPCSAFSTLGSRDKGWGKTKKYSDSAQVNVEDLFFDYIRMVDGVKPKVFVAENVAGLAKGKAKGYLNQILRGLKACGYHVEAKILDARWLGVPQSRSRLIIVGVRDDLWREEYKGRLHPSPHKKIVTLGEAFKGLEFTEDDRVETDIKRYAAYKKLITLSMGETHYKAFSLNKASQNSYCPCITATDGRKGAYGSHHWDNRLFTVAEVKRIMSIPDDYILTGDYSKQVERLGRMVAPFMYRELSNTLIRLGVL